MASGKEIKQRIKSVKSTKKITKAMELVAASKMKKAVSQTLSSRLYATFSSELLTSISSRIEDIQSKFFVENDNTKTLFILITSNRGLCGAYNSQILKKTILNIKQINKEEIDIITVGKKGDSAMRRLGMKVVASFTDMPESVNPSDAAPLAKLIIDEYKKGEYKNVRIAYTDFVSALTQKANIKKILPISKTELKEFIDSVGEENSAPVNTKLTDTPYLFEGDPNKLIESLAEKLIKMQIYQMILESNASEQSARMIAMKNATEAAGEMIGELTLSFNKARQAGITQEISEISAGMASLS